MSDTGYATAQCRRLGCAPLSGAEQLDVARRWQAGEAYGPIAVEFGLTLEELRELAELFSVSEEIRLVNEAIRLTAEGDREARRQWFATRFAAPPEAAASRCPPARAAAPEAPSPQEASPIPPPADRPSRGRRALDAPQVREIRRRVNVAKERPAAVCLDYQISPELVGRVARGTAYAEVQ